LAVEYSLRLTVTGGKVLFTQEGPVKFHSHYLSNTYREQGEMRTLHADRGITSVQVGVAIALVLLLSFLVVFLVRHEDTNWPQSAFERSVKQLQIIQAMSRDLLASAEAEKSRTT
jgi:hypothetical protein